MGHLHPIATSAKARKPTTSGLVVRSRPRRQPSSTPLCSWRAKSVAERLFDFRPKLAIRKAIRLSRKGAKPFAVQGISPSNRGMAKIFERGARTCGAGWPSH